MTCCDVLAAVTHPNPSPSPNPSPIPSPDSHPNPRQAADGDVARLEQLYAVPGINPRLETRLGQRASLVPRTR